MDDIEDTDELNELEAQLYSQQHHEAVSNTEHSIHVENINSTISSGDKSSSAQCRYWANQNDGRKSVQLKRRNTYPSSKQNKPPMMNLNPCSFSATGIVRSNVASSSTGSRENVETDKIGSKPFRPYTSVLAIEGALLQASEGSPKPQGSNQDKSFANNSKKNNNNKRKNKDPKVGKSGTVNEARTIDERNEKLVRKIKMEMKKFRGKLVEEVTKRNCFETIVVDSSEEEENDVVEIPVTPPPLVTIDSSDSSDKEVENEKQNTTENSKNNGSIHEDVSHFAKPQNIDKPKDQRENSRCTSPNSVISDDFIVQADRTRLRANDITTIDEDLLCIQETVDQRLNHKEKNRNSSHMDSSSHKEIQDLSNDIDNFVIPLENRYNSKKRPTVECNYQVNESSLPAVDVYESESSDMPESIYSKGEKQLSEKRAPDEKECSDIEEIEFIPRIKRLRKRKRSNSSGTNKNNEHQSGAEVVGDAEASSEEDEEENDNLKTNVPFISRGEAVESHKLHFKRRMKSNTTGSLSDNEFYNKISTMSKGGAENGSSSEEESGKSDEDITARKIAENVINKRKQKRNSQKTGETENRDELNGSGSAKTVNVDIEEDKNEAIPERALMDIQSIFNKIDVIDQRQANETDNENDDDGLDCEEAREHFILDSLPESRKRRKSRNTQQNLYVPPEKRSEELKDVNKNNNGLEVVHSNQQFVGWNDEMFCFYEKTWGQRNFNVKAIRHEMTGGSREWKIHPFDRHPRVIRDNRSKCFNCCEFGHMRVKCPRPPKPLICFMCGQTGHREPRCPNTCCLRCGKKTSMFTKICKMCSNQKSAICFICKIRGHSVQMCPDKWRRYHSTTKPNEYPSKEVIYNKRRFCCICAEYGHLPEYCKSYLRLLEYPTSVSEIKSFAKSYEDTLLHSTSIVNNMTYNMVSQPDDNVNFKFSKNTLSLNNCYGRFLKSVGLGYMLRCEKKKSQTVVSGIDYSKEIIQIEEGEKPNKHVIREYLPNPFAHLIATSQKSAEKSCISQQNEKNKNKNDVKNGNKLSTGDIIINTISKSSSNDEITENNTFINILDENDLEKEKNNEDTNEGNSDSNYSFSEHFCEISSSTLKTKNNDELSTNDVSLDQSDLNEMLVEEELINNEETTQSDDENKTQKENPRDLETSTNEEYPHTSSSSLSDVVWSIDTISQVSKEKSSTSLPSKIKECRKVGPLPDFIPLESNEVPSISSHDSNPENIAVIDGDTEMESVPNLQEPNNSNENSPKAKIYLTNFHSRFILSPNGKKYLEDLGKKYDIKSSINCSSVGNVLVLEGAWYKQDSFHKELLMMFTNLSENLKRQQLERSQRLPKKRETLIKILQDGILQLKSNLGNVNEIFNRLKVSQSKPQSKSSWRATEKARRALNMILIGQVGLANGQELLRSLQDYIKNLIENSNEEFVSEELREEIEERWKVIFTSYPQDNYEILLKKYYELRKNKAIPKVTLDPKILNEKVVDVTFTPEQEVLLRSTSHQQNQIQANKERLMKQVIPPPPRFIQDERYFTDVNNQNNNESLERNKTLNNSAGPSSSGSSLISHGNDEVNYNKVNTVPGNNRRNFRDNQFRSRQQRAYPGNRRNFDNRHGRQFQNFSNNTNENNNNNTNNNTNYNNNQLEKPSQAGFSSRKQKKGSVFWSAECLRIASECFNIINYNGRKAHLLGGLRRAEYKARRNMLTQGDFRVLEKIRASLTV